MADLKRYKCVKTLVLDLYDDDGYSTDETMAVEVGETFEVKNRYPYNIVGGADCVHIENDDGRWLELMPKTIAEHFVEVKEG